MKMLDSGGAGTFSGRPRISPPAKESSFRSTHSRKGIFVMIKPFVVCGATGNIGSRIADILPSTGEPVTVGPGIFSLGPGTYLAPMGTRPPACGIQ
jgi:hypothetical protein